MVQSQRGAVAHQIGLELSDPSSRDVDVLHRFHGPLCLIGTLCFACRCCCFTMMSPPRLPPYTCMGCHCYCDEAALMTMRLASPSSVVLPDEGMVHYFKEPSATVETVCNITARTSIILSLVGVHYDTTDGAGQMNQTGLMQTMSSDTHAAIHIQPCEGGGECRR